MPGFLQSLKDLREKQKKSKASYIGRCNACGRLTLFLEHGAFTFTDMPWRNDLRCLHCGSFSRQRALIASVCGLFGAKCANLRLLPRLLSEHQWTVYNAAAQGTVHEFLKDCPRYTCSEFFANVPPGTCHNGVRCEDLQAMTFPDASFDLVITEDVLEHIRRPDAALRSIHRVLKPGGFHVFTIPIFGPKTLNRVDTSTDRDVFLEPHRYHGDPLCPEGVLVYNDFGLDAVDMVQACGFHTRMLVHNGRNWHRMCGHVFISQKPGSEHLP